MFYCYLTYKWFRIRPGATATAAFPVQNTATVEEAHEQLNYCFGGPFGWFPFHVCSVQCSIPSKEGNAPAPPLGSLWQGA